MAAAVKQEGRDHRNLRSVEQPLALQGAAVHMNDADDDRCEAGPLHTAASLEHFPAVFTDPAQAALAGITLSDRVSGDQAEYTAQPDQTEGTSKEVGR